MARQTEEDFPAGHPARFDYDPASPQAVEWARVNVHPLGDRDFPVDHPKAVDTPGNTNAIQWQAGVDPHNPHREAHTGRTPEQAAAVAAMSAEASKRAQESPVVQPVDAMEVNTALDKKRAALGRDVLTPDEYSAVLAEIQSKPRTRKEAGDVRVNVQKQHDALNLLLANGWNHDDAMKEIEARGADEILAAGSKPALKE